MQRLEPRETARRKAAGRILQLQLAEEKRVVLQLE
jgi:hypothetical protein